MVSSTPRPHFTLGKDPVPIVQEAGWVPGPVWTGAGNLATPGIRSPDRPARNQSLYRLSYPNKIVLTGIKALLKGASVIMYGRDSSVGMAIRYGMDGPGIEPRRKGVLRTCPDGPRGPPILLYKRYRWVKRPGACR